MFFFFKQKTAYEMRISDWSSDVCSSDLVVDRGLPGTLTEAAPQEAAGEQLVDRQAQSAERRGDRDAERDQQQQDRECGAEHRSEERRVGKECVSTGRSRWAA